MKSVCICGSKRFKKEMEDFAKELEAEGVIVFQPNLKEPLPEDAEIENEHFTEVIFRGLTLEHFDWINKSDICFVYNKNGYVGVSVSLEMGYATAKGKPVFALTNETGDPCRDALIDKTYKNPKELLKVLL